MAGYVNQVTLQYSTFIKGAVMEALQEAFAIHPDPTVQKTFVGLDFAHKQFSLPALIVKWYEREIKNAGVGHEEWLPSPYDPNPDAPTYFDKYYHRIYTGDFSFDIWGMSSVDRDLVRDALVEILTMTDITVPGDTFIQRLYYQLNTTPYGLWHFPFLNTDLLNGYGEKTQAAPWGSEDGLVYQVNYRIPVMGEFYSKPPSQPGTSLQMVSQVDVYPYIEGTDPLPSANPDSPTVQIGVLAAPLSMTENTNTLYLLDSLAQEIPAGVPILLTYSSGGLAITQTFFSQGASTGADAISVSSQLATSPFPIGATLSAKVSSPIGWYVFAGWPPDLLAA